MEVLIVTRIHPAANGEVRQLDTVLAVLENPGVISPQAVLLAWAKSQGLEKVPNGINVQEATVTPLAKSLYGIMPYSELNQLEQEANPEQPRKHG